MAIPHLRAQIIGAGKSAVRYAAYRHRARMLDKLEGSNTHRYDKEKDLVYSEFSIPDNSPAWLSNPIGQMKSNVEKSEWLWNYVQNNERINGQLSREIVIGLPKELSPEQNINLVREFVEINLTKRGLVSDWVYHDKKENPHIHLMHTLRPVSENGLGKKKIPVFNADGTIKRKQFTVIEKDGTVRKGERIVYENVIGYKDAMKSLRISWGDIASRHLALAGHGIKIDMRSFEERGISIEPTIHLGQSASSMQAKGKVSDVVLASEELKEKSAERIKKDPDEILKILSFEKSTFTRKDIARTLNRYVDDSQIFNDVLTRINQSDNLVRLQDKNNPNLAVYSTRDIIEAEYYMVSNVDFLAQTKGYGVKAGIVAAAISAVENKEPDQSFKFESEQVAAVHHVVADNGAAVIVGYAGAGKSTLLEAANLAWTTSGHRVFGAALSGKAAEGLEQSSRIKSRTLASWEHGWNNGNDALLPGDIFVIDEAGMVSSRQLSRFIEKIKDAGAKAVLVGDPMQLQPIEAGAAFRAIADQIGYVELAGIRRQKAEWARESSIKFAHGKVKEALDDYRTRGFIHEAQTQDETVGKIVHDWMDSYRNLAQESSRKGKLLKGNELIVLAHTNAAVTELNAGIRQALKNEGFLTPEGVKAVAHYITQKGEREFVVNDRIIFLENARFEEATAPELGQQEVKNGMLGTVIATRNERGREILKVRLDCGREVVFSNKTYQNIDHGYATTIHKSQGITVDNAFVLATPTMDQHLAYVAMSRHRHDASLYFAAEDFENVPIREHQRISGMLAGELVETGYIKFADCSVTQTPYADIKTASGVERIYGMRLPAAIDGIGIQLGDIIEVRQSKEVSSGGKYKRNIFDVTLIEKGTPSFAWQIMQQNASYYDRLVAALSRTGAKSVTMDYAQFPDYRDYISSFTRNHGIDTEQGLGRKIIRSLGVSQEWVSAQKQKLVSLWDRAKAAFERIQKRAIAPLTEFAESANVTSRQTDDDWICLDAYSGHKISIEDAAKSGVRREKSYIDNFAEIGKILQNIYRDSQSASIRIEKTILAGGGDELPDILLKSPEKAGELRGSDRFLDKLKASGRERRDALDNLPLLVSKIRELQSFYKNSYNLHVSSEINARERMKHAVPALSDPAKAFMQDIAAGHASYSNMPASVEKELARLNDALNRRFGREAIHRHDFHMMQSIPPEQQTNKERIRELHQAIKFVQRQRKFEIQ